MINKYGLSRVIPPEVKREVRQKAGFGCVICGASIYEYEHIHPEFSEAKTHDPERITLLCPQHHSKVTRKFLSKLTVQIAMQNPICKRKGFSNEFLDIGQSHPKITFSGLTIEKCPIPVMFKNIPLIEIKAAESGNAPFRLSATFFNSEGNLSLKIEDNEWMAYESNWDVEVTGGNIIVRDSLRHISLKLVAQPPEGIKVERLDMLIGNVRFRGNENSLKVIYPDGAEMILTQCIASHCNVGLSIG